MFDFQKLTVYKRSKVFNAKVKTLISKRDIGKLPTDQLSRAAFSICLNIAEGSGRFSKADRRHFFVISRSSVFECVAILDILSDENVITESEYLVFQEEADELSRMLFGMIKNLS